MEVKSKNFLVDVPVMVYIWIRPELQRRQFEVIKKARPSKLFLVSDGGRNETEWSAIRQNREMYDMEVDWNCEVHRLYKEKNCGNYGLIYEVHDFVFQKVDRMIMLEDDILPSISFFHYCAKLLEKYKDDERIGMICGVNLAGENKDTPYDYFFSRKGSIQGIATWKRVHDQYYNFDYGKNKYTMKILREYTKGDKPLLKAINQYAKHKYYEGHVAGEEFFCKFGVYAHHQLFIIPKFNLVSNQGCTENSAHSIEYKMIPNGIKKVYNMKTQEIKFPLKHPEYVIPDLFYEYKWKWILGYDHLFVDFMRRIEGWILRIRYGKFRYYFKRWIKRVASHRQEG